MKVQTYSTADIVLAAVLKYKGYRLDSIQKVENRGIFYFIDVDTEVLEDFDLFKIAVEPIAFNEQIRNLSASVKRKISGV